MTKPNYTHIHILFDKSGSMTSRKDDVNGWWKTFIAEQKKLTLPCTISVAQFDTESYETTIEWADIKNVADEFDLRPQGGTPLIDSAMRSIDDLGARLAKMKEEDRPSAVVVIVQTDGEENSSRKHTLAELKDKVKEQTDKWKWDFVFLGAGIDAYGDAQKMGFSVTSTANFSSDAIGYATNAVMTSAAVMRKRTWTTGSFSYTAEEQKSMDNTTMKKTP